MKQANVIFNEKRALEVFTILCNAWKNKDWIFENVVLPEDQFKQYIDAAQLDPIGHAHWLFIASLPQRGGVMAEDPFAPLWHLFVKDPGLFDPKTVAREWSIEKIIAAIQSVAPLVTKGESTGERDAGAMGYKLDQHAKAWYGNCQMITERFDGNILNLFKAVHNVPRADKFERAFALIDNHKSKVYGINGMRRKIFSLFIIWLQKEKLVSSFPCPVPVDFHALRVMLATGVIKFRNMVPVPAGTKHMQALVGVPFKKITETVINEIALWINPFLYKNKLSHMDLNPALWVLGRELCAAHPQSYSYLGNKKFLFPQDFKNGLKDKDGNRLKIPKRASLCNACLVERYCDHALPSKPYYKAGSLVLIPRVKTLFSKPVHTLFGKELFDFKGHKHSRSKQQGIEQFTQKNYSLPVKDDEAILIEVSDQLDLF
jgi:hypothetical protein